MTAQFSDNEEKMLALGLSHLARFLPEWDCQLRSIAAKLNGGTALYDQLKELESPEGTRASLLEDDKSRSAQT